MDVLSFSIITRTLKPDTPTSKYSVQLFSKNKAVPSGTTFILFSIKRQRYTSISMPMGQ